MTRRKTRTSFPFRPDAEDLKSTENDVSEIPAIQERLHKNHKDLARPDRVAHQYQIAGGKVTLKIANELPLELQSVGLFEPAAQHIGIARISTGLGTPHIETNPDFLGIMLAFRTKTGNRVDFLGINDPTAPTDNHQDFMTVLHATGESSGAEIPFLGTLGKLNIGDLLAEQTKFLAALVKRMGLGKAGKTATHILDQTKGTAHSISAYQTYWTGIEEVGGTACKFTLVPIPGKDEHVGFNLGERHLSDEWKKRQGEADVEFQLWWIPFLNEDETSTNELTGPWKEEHKRLVGAVTFPKMDLDSDEAKLWASLASEMGANPGNWVHDKENSIKEPATEFGVARKIAYRMSQEGRDALEPKLYQSVFETGQISADLAGELTRRRDEKEKAGHVSWAP